MNIKTHPHGATPMPVLVVVGDVVVFVVAAGEYGTKLINFVVGLLVTFGTNDFLVTNDVGGTVVISSSSCHSMLSLSTTLLAVWSIG